ncbi:MAG: hypothetical protein A2X25_03890 [Chloroflexi bacterium GWB2_49_20]|nr:MAG: hypothetical protein A2X25_03890 [Chloroflexi bacterium GWB2_49_20]OGN76725.1 MAG: hypothetical protein A2X26_10980 [Chloroflexi bacterium GWC2_49_37]OGN83685.1 MAG: hypothetical protein A2X27_01635 [Chloroflexi bacterium GWD2_49_16]HBG74192.1 ABC transporter ATP-binding protein [Anaerolineae bacterium]HCC78991.1 ABC transporter ATP-binding protein [Anaerolineae bacterium]
MTNKIGFEVKLKDTYEEAMQKLTESLKREGFGILTQIDVQKTLKDKLGVDFRRYAILGVCNPSLAHRALTRNPEAGLLLPCTVTMETEADGSTTIRIADPEIMLNIGQMGKDEELANVGKDAREKLLRVAQSLQ